MRIAGVLVVAVVLGGATSALAAPSYVTAEGCTEQQAFVEGDDAAVDARLPDRYEPIRTPSGAPLVFARALRCDAIAAAGDPYPALQASYGVVIESPDGLGCLSGAPLAGPIQGDALPICNWYVLAWLADDRRTVDWLEAGGSGFPVFRTPNMSFELTDEGEFHFEAEGPSPYSIDAVNEEPSPGEKAVRGGYWADTPTGTVKLVASSNELVSGGAEGAVTAAPGSELAALMGADEKGYAPFYSGFASVGIRRGSYRKQLPGGDRRGQSFEGSCTAEGDVVFTPPLTNATAQARYDYEAAGTCSGDLNGREVTEAPVTLRQSGPVEASCTEAHTTFPGDGLITFESGEAARYTLDFAATLTEVDFMFYGEQSGSGRGHGTFLTDRTPPDVPQRCAGEGLEAAPLDVSFTTESAFVNERAGRLRASVSPSAVRVGRRRTFKFSVLTRAGEAAIGAAVRFAGTTDRVGRSGKARIVTTLRRAGRYRARISKPGFRRARVSVRARA